MLEPEIGRKVEAAGRHAISFRGNAKKQCSPLESRVIERLTAKIRCPPCFSFLAMRKKKKGKKCSEKRQQWAARWIGSQSVLLLRINMVVRYRSLCLEATTESGPCDIDYFCCLDWSIFVLHCSLRNADWVQLMARSCFWSGILFRISRRMEFLYKLGLFIWTWDFLRIDVSDLEILKAVTIITPVMWFIK